MTSTQTDLPRYAKRIMDLAATDTQLQQLMPDPEVYDALSEPGLSLAQIVATALDGFADRPALGARAFEVVRDAETGRATRAYLPSFTTVTHDEVHHRVKGLANAWRHHEQHRVRPGEFVNILGFSGIDYTVIELACTYTQAVSVPLQSTLAGADLDGVFADTEPTAVVATVADVVLAARLAGTHGSIRSVVVIDYDERVDDDREQYAAARAVLTESGCAAALTTLDELIAVGESTPWEFVPATEDTDERMAMILHSSGSTGRPKGAIIPERIMKGQFTFGLATVPLVRMCFAPMNHLAGRMMVFSTLTRGGTAYFTTKPDLSMLFEDIRLVRPTEMLAFPRVLELVHRHYLGEVVRRQRGGQTDPDAVRTQVMADMRHTFLGDRLALVTVGSAPTTPEVQRFVKDCFQVAFLDGYGSTEAGSNITVRDRIVRPSVLDYRLRDVPELGYYVTDKPYPRGELCVKTTQTVPGYFKRPDATAALFDEDGYLLTGDIMEERGPDHVVYIDRRNDVLKLSQGEYIAAGALGTTYEDGSPVIAQIYVYGNSTRSYLLAVVVPNPDVVFARLGERPSDAQVRALIRSELKAVADANDLKSFEIPRDFIVETEPFTHENGLLSGLHKRMRPNLERKYGDRLEALYAESERKQNDDLMALQDPNSALSVLEKVGKAVEATLGIQGVDVAQPHSWGDLGGDSLGATGFSALLGDIFGVTLPVNAILSPAGNPRQWARIIKAALADDQGDRPTFAAVHGEGARRVDAKDLDITAFLDADTLEQAATTAPAAQARTVLLTGATGYLGRFLCLEWLERLANVDGKLICLIRAADHDAATRRLVEAFDGADPALAQRFRALAERHLEVIVGDVAAARLGVSDGVFDRLAREVDHIVHPAALVNHMLPYSDLFEPNVVGTAELVRLAITERQKGIDFVSTVATTRLLDTTERNGEDSPLLQRLPLGNAYGTGYAISKWAAEHLLHSAHRRFGLPVNVFRGDMMLAHRGCSGQINVADVFTRLLFSVVTTGLAPESFYGLDSDGHRQPAHYDGLPVDFVAAAIADIGGEASREFRTFHVFNHHVDDGLSMDVFVDWIEAAGYSVERVRDHRRWVERFEEKLTALPVEQRQHTSLAVLDSLRQPWNAHEALPSSTAFQDAVRRLPVGPEVPHLDRGFIEKCLDALWRLGLIPAPASAALDEEEMLAA
ncbi:MAG TPA: carboxylic acid reductase [Aldersonia sp.]